MTSSRIANRWQATLALLGFLGAGSAWGQDQPNQTLDQVDAFDSANVLEMLFDRQNPNPAIKPDFAALGLGSAAGLASCKLASSGLYCLAKDSETSPQVVRQWVLPLAGPGGSPTNRFRCNDLGFELGESGTCTGLTVDMSGAIWVSGKKGSNYSLVKLVKPSALPTKSCTGGWVQVDSAPSTTPLCAREFASGPGVLSDLDAVDGEVAYPPTLPIGPGILALNGTSGDVRYFSPLVDPPQTVSTFSNWGLDAAAGERLLSTTLLQRRDTQNVVSGNYILAATTKGRILSVDVKNADTPTDTTMATPVLAPPGMLPQAQPPVTINSSSCTSATRTCNVPGVALSATNSTGGAANFFVKAALGGKTGLGVQGKVPGEIAVGETVKVQFLGNDPYRVSSIQIVYLFNGPEFGDKAEIALVTADGDTADGASYTLKIGNDKDDADATWSNPDSTVTKCGLATSDPANGSGCFKITNPFPAPVRTLAFTASTATSNGYESANTNDSDFAIGEIKASVDYRYGIRTSFKTGRVYVSDSNARAVRALLPGTGTPYVLNPLPAPNDILSTTLTTPTTTLTTVPDGLTVAPGNSVDLANCETTTCTVIPGATGQPPSVTFDSVELNGDSPTGVTVYQIRGLIDCRYAPIDCSNLLGVAPIGSPPFDDSEYMEGLISAGIIIPLDPSKPALAKNRYRPAAQLLNVTPMLPEDVTALFSESGGLPDLQISRTYRAQRGTDPAKPFRFDALFYKTAKGQVFINTLFTDVEVNQLTGTSLGCNDNDPPVTLNNPIPTYETLLKFDVVTRVSEKNRSVSDFFRAAQNDYRDTIINDGCGGSRGQAPELSLLPINLMIAPATYGPQSTSNTQSVTENNDAVFARLVESLYDDLNRSRAQLACTTFDGGTSPPVGTGACSALASKWSAGKTLLNSCVSSAFSGQSTTTTNNCKAFRDQLNTDGITTYGATIKGLPVALPSNDPANRVGGQKAQLATLTRIFDERFLPSIRPKGWCREKTAPNGYKGCPDPAFVLDANLYPPTP
jgi:hypothetical protein